MKSKPRGVSFSDAGCRGRHERFGVPFQDERCVACYCAGLPWELDVRCLGVAPGRADEADP